MIDESACLTLDDRVALRELVDRYAAYADQRRFEALADLFTTDALLIGPATPDPWGPRDARRGRAAIVTSMDALDRVPVTQHAVVGQVLEDPSEPGTVTGRVACVAHHLRRSRDGEVRDSVWHLRYQDTYRREEHSWSIARRELHVEWIETREVEQWRE